MISCRQGEFEHGSSRGTLGTVGVQNPPRCDRRRREAEGIRSGFGERSYEDDVLWVDGDRLAGPGLGQLGELQDRSPRGGENQRHNRLGIAVDGIPVAPDDGDLGSGGHRRARSDPGEAAAQPSEAGVLDSSDMTIGDLGRIIMSALG